jgi:polysaccharide biosynthesis protein PslJ
VRIVEGAADRGSFVSLAFVSGALAILAFAVLTGLPILDVAPVVGVFVVSAVWYRALLVWPTLLTGLLVVILVIPIRRYALPGSLPFELEPYRLLVAFIGTGWLASLLVDPRVHLRRSAFDAPLAAVVGAILCSISASGGRIHELGVGEIVGKKLTFIASFVLIYYVIVSVVRGGSKDAELLVKVLVAGAAVVAGFALIEYRTGFNAFNRLSEILPALELREVLSSEAVARGGRLRVYASAQHPIALGAMLMMLLPLALYLARSSGRRRWWFAAGLLAMGALATLSRTSIVMLLVIVGVFLWLRPRETKRFWPMLLPALVVVHLALPGTIGTIKESFFPSGGLIAEQQQGPGGRGSGRIADIGPALGEFSERPLLGGGYGTRVVDEGPKTNALILDNQWLGTLLETGLIGGLAWLWLFVRAVRRFGARAKEDDSARGWLMAAMAASTAAFAVGMATFDAFSFIQVTFLAFILLGLGAVHLSPAPAEGRRRRAAEGSAA